jgi:predicted acylesterase/phospholipase RssA
MYSFEHVRDAEQSLIGAKSSTKTPAAAALPADAGKHIDEKSRTPLRAGLAFSGGGIRSATFNLGILQGLANANLLDKIDYLSTVSGGGYIGAWLIRWIKDTNTKYVQEQLGHFQPHLENGSLLAEPKEINFLRAYSNYLTPRKGIFGADTWAAIAAYIRNVALNQTILIAFLGAILFLPWIVGRALAVIQEHYKDANSVPLALASYVVLALTLCYASDLAAGCPNSKEAAPKRANQKFVMGGIVLPLFVSAMLLAGALWVNGTVDPWDQSGRTAIALNGKTYAWYVWGATGAVVFFIANLIGVAARYRYLHLGDRQRGELTGHQVFGIPFFAAIAGFFGGLLLMLLQWLFYYWRVSTSGAGLWHAVSWGTPLMVALFLAAGTLHIGLLRLLIPNYEQEWWARLAGLLYLVSIAWASLFGLVVFVPLGIAFFLKWIGTKLALLAGWAGTTLWGILSGKSSKSSGHSADKPGSGKLMLLAPYVFVAGLIVLLSMGGHWLTLELSHLTSAPGASPLKTDLVSRYWHDVGALDALELTIGMLVLLLLALGLAFRVDINTFSMNLLYRNRVVRCYLGAARPEAMRHPNPFTGFDQSDDLLLTNFLPGPGYDGPYPIICAALNVTHGERLAWQERKAESFVFTPAYCGFEYPDMHPDDAAHVTAYHKTTEYAYPQNPQNPAHKAGGGPRLGTSISISGAAASPNMGSNTSPPLAFLMTVFNVRLGWWLANPRYDNKDFPLGPPEGGPRLSLLYLLKELFASTTDRSKYIYLSDGGHFENLAVYELVRRRCPFIIASDADEDTDMKFGDLGNAIRKCRSDFGVEIELDTTALKPDKKTRFAETHGVLGTIRYPKGPKGEPAFLGHILYIKTTMTKGVPRDVLAYRDMNGAFPDDPTANQWFDESQFESYRSLGFHSFKSLAAMDGEESKSYPMTIPQLFDVVRFVTGSLPSKEVAATSHM